MPHRSDRLPGLDLLRAGAALAVLLAHAAVPYTRVAMPGLVWPVGHRQTHPAVDALFWLIMTFIMPLFFAISGYCSAVVLAERGPREFLARRVRRILFPFLAAAVVLLPLEFYLWLLGWVVEGRLAPRKLLSLKLEALHQDLWGFSHLWYLQYLFLISLTYAGWMRFRSTRETSDGRLHLYRRRNLLAGAFPPGMATMNARGSWLLPVLRTAALAAAILALSPRTLVGFQHGFLPFPAKFALSAVFFGFGVSLRGAAVPSRAARWTMLGGLAVATSVLLPWVHAEACVPLAGWSRIALGLVLGCFATLAVACCWWGIAARKGAAGPTAGFLAGASFWIYLVHHPLVALCQIALAMTVLSAVAQFALAAALSLGLSVASYEVLVRKTRLGAFLNGRTTPAPVPAEGLRTAA